MRSQYVWQNTYSSYLTILIDETIVDYFMEFRNVVFLITTPTIISISIVGLQHLLFAVWRVK